MKVIAELRTELLNTRTELLTAIKEQTDRVENAAMKIKLQEMEEQKQKERLCLLLLSLSVGFQFISLF